MFGQVIVLGRDDEDDPLGRGGQAPDEGEAVFVRQVRIDHHRVDLPGRQALLRFARSGGDRDPAGQGRELRLSPSRSAS